MFIYSSMYTHRLRIYIYIYIYMCVLHVYIYIYIWASGSSAPPTFWTFHFFSACQIDWQGQWVWTSLFCPVSNSLRRTMETTFFCLQYLWIMRVSNPLRRSAKTALSVCIDTYTFIFVDRHNGIGWVFQIHWQGQWIWRHGSNSLAGPSTPHPYVVWVYLHQKPTNTVLTNIEDTKSLTGLTRPMKYDPGRHGNTDKPHETHKIWPWKTRKYWQASWDSRNMTLEDTKILTGLTRLTKYGPWRD